MIYVEGVKIDSKYTIRAHTIFVHNFLNIQPVFNPKKVFESPKSQHSKTLINLYVDDKYVEACQRC